MNDTINIYYQEEIDGDYTVRRKDGTILIEDLEKNEACEIVCRWNSHDAMLAALRAWQKYDTESADKHPCPDYTLRTAYRAEARKLTEAAIELAKKEG